ncbi:MAG TPA: PASTA domain-containing protein [Actinoplanes sp.]|nr:PASTA domain-containing protein [Actinoplanes sp.]
MPEERTGRDEPDETREFSPFVPGEAPTGPSDTEVGPDGGPRSSGSVDDATKRIRVDRTAMMPPAGAPDPGRAEAAARAAAGPLAPDWETRSTPAWSGRAEVRPVRPGAGGDYSGTQWTAMPSEPRRLWWSPILIGVLALLLVALLGTGIWLIYGSAGDDAVPVQPSAVAPATRVVTTAAPSVTRTTERPTTAPPTTADVVIPALKGLPAKQAQRALDRVGLAYRLKFLPSDAPPGTVVDSDPAEGREVPADTEVTLFLAVPQSATPSISASPTRQGGGAPGE